MLSHRSSHSYGGGNSDEFVFIVTIFEKFSKKMSVRKRELPMHISCLCLAGRVHKQLGRILSWSSSVHIRQCVGSMYAQLSLQLDRNNQNWFSFCVHNCFFKKITLQNYSEPCKVNVYNAAWKYVVNL